MTFLEKLQMVVTEDKILQEEPLSAHTSFRIGGPAQYFLLPEEEEELVRLVALCVEEKMPYLLLGNGSNVLAKDEGLRGVVICTKNLQGISWGDGNTVTAQCGLLLGAMAADVLKHSCTGFEFASGIPGTVGGAVLMNAGAYGGEMKDCMVSARTLTREGTVKEYTVQELELSYRHSILQDNGEILLSATFHFESGDSEEIRSRMQELNQKRREKQPLEHASAGSTFKRPEGYFAGKLIDDAGLRGYRVGDVMVSEKHCGFVVNVGNGTYAQAMEVIRHVQEEVLAQFGVELRLEVRQIG